VQHKISPTAAFDVDPVVGSTSAPGFSEMAGIYRQYRVLASGIKVNFSNLDLLAGVGVVVPVNFDPAANTTNFQNYLSNRSARTVPLGLSTGDGAGAVRHNFSLRDFAGVLTNSIDTYASAVNAIPTNNVWWLVGAYLSAVQTNGVFVSVLIDFDIEFFELSSPPT
jgi:hypothetical protein